ncbi:hypothetical protein J4573_08575 [Actinomadura barringtoniae]|uniref:Uncharacterized protein n=1 Tax=Actinomadura barringtoniae TaxID=1427535 RepID=A0A939PBR0_9ACTN|nr:hypothetical protein [Actinomadura barringtoniae]MBO2447138.1 hypothetical protein [Actinomadura barringtoniae]
MHDYILYVSRQIRSAERPTALLAAAFMGLELIERAATLLTETAPASSRDLYQVVLGEASDAWWSLSKAPALAWANEPANDDRGPGDLAESLQALVQVVVDALQNVADRTPEPEDRAACLQAIAHSAHVRDALSREASGAGW